MNLYKQKKLKINKKLILQKSIIKGKIGEEIAKEDYRKNGFTIKDTKYGSDFEAFKRIPTNKILHEHVEVKTGKARLSKKQKATRNKLKQQGIHYSEYRVTDEHLLHQLKQSKYLQQILSSFGYDIDQFKGKFLIKDPTSCPNCGVTADGMIPIVKNFGLRNKGDGVVKVQSWCRDCRNKSRRHKP